MRGIRGREGGIVMALGAVALAGCASTFLMQSDRHARDDDGLKPEQVRRQRFVEGPEGRVEVFVERHGLAKGEEPRYFILEHRGKRGGAASGSRLPREVVEVGPVEIWVVSYPGYGASDGRARIRSIAPAAQAAYDGLARRAGGRPIIVYGFSLGSTAALHLAATRPVAGAIIHNVPCLTRLIMTRFGWWNLWLMAIPVSLQVPPELSCRGAATRATAPGFYVISERDEVCPVRHQWSSFRAYAGPKRAVVMAGARHHAGFPSPARAALRSWIGETLAAATPGPRLADGR